MRFRKIQNSTALHICFFRLAIFEDGEDWGSAIVAFSKGSALSDEGLCKNVGSVVDVWDVESPDDALSLLSPTPLEDPVADILGVAGIPPMSVIDTKPLNV